MSDNKETKKKGFFSRLLGGSDTVDTSNALEKNEVKEDSKSLSRAEEVASAQGADDIPNAITEPSKPKVNTLSKSALSKMKKADIVSFIKGTIKNHSPQKRFFLNLLCLSQYQHEVQPKKKRCAGRLRLKI